MRLPPLVDKILWTLRSDRESTLQGLRTDIQELIRAVRDEQAAYREQKKDTQRLDYYLPDRIIRAEREIEEYTQREQNTYRKLNLWIQVILVTGTWLTFIALMIYAGITFGQLRQQITATSAAQQSADTAKETLIVTERPWITVEEMQPDDPGVSFNKDGSFSMNAKFRVKNIGHSVATDIYLSPQTMAPVWGGQQMFFEPVDRQTKYCDDFRKQKFDRRWVKTLFPGDDTWFYMGINIDKAEMKKAFAANTKAFHQPPRGIAPIVYGCVNYQFKFSDEVHQTRFIFTISQRDPTGRIQPRPNSALEIPLGDNLPASEVVIQKDVWGAGIYAD
jgi:hypothetical protein